MANESFIRDGKTFLKCKQCLEFKELGKDQWYVHNQGYLGVLGRCKECILDGRKTEKELSMSRIRDYNRFHYNEKRRKYIFELSSKRRKEKGYGPKHLKASRKAKGIRPVECPFCNRVARIVFHHFDYNKPYQGVFCCDICHSKIHRGLINFSNNIIDLIKNVPF